MSNKTSKLFYLLLVLLPFSLLAQEEDEPKWEINGYLKNLQSASLIQVPNFITGQSELVILSNNLIHNRLNFSRALGSKLVFNSSLRNRFLYGDLDTPERMLEQFEQGNDFLDLSLEGQST